MKNSIEAGSSIYLLKVCDYNLPKHGIYKTECEKGKWRWSCWEREVNRIYKVYPKNFLPCFPLRDAVRIKCDNGSEIVLPNIKQ